MRIGLTIITFGAISAIVAGCWWIYPPAALIVGGGLVLADVLHILRSGRQSNDS